MSDIQKKFHQFALQSILFKGRADWYFCYLKSEKIAHVLFVLAEQSELKEREMAFKLAGAAAELPYTIAHFAAGEVDAPVVVADIFSLLSRVRLCATGGLLSQENSSILLAEYEALAERFSISVHPSPFASAEDFAVPEMTQGELPAPRHSGPMLSQSAGTQGFESKGHKGQPKGQSESGQKGHSPRLEKILDFVRNNPQSSIKDIAAVIRNCSEKTIQRELAILIAEGYVKKLGERRWSVYVAIG